MDTLGMGHPIPNHLRKTFLRVIQICPTMSSFHCQSTTLSLQRQPTVNEDVICTNTNIVMKKPIIFYLGTNYIRHLNDAPSPEYHFQPSITERKSMYLIPFQQTNVFITFKTLKYQTKEYVDNLLLHVYT